MAEIYKQKMTVEMDEEFVVFIIGMRINKPWKVHKWWPAFNAMPGMLKELSANPELGMLGYRFANHSGLYRYPDTACRTSCCSGGPCSCTRESHGTPICAKSTAQ